MGPFLHHANENRLWLWKISLFPKKFPSVQTVSNNDYLKVSVFNSLNYSSTDLYVKLYVVNISTQKRVIKKKTRVCRHDREPSFNETFRFSLSPAGHSLQVILHFINPNFGCCLCSPVGIWAQSSTPVVCWKEKTTKKVTQLYNNGNIRLGEILKDGLLHHTTVRKGIYRSGLKILGLICS